jgi:hypothetical protein
LEAKELEVDVLHPQLARCNVKRRPKFRVEADHVLESFI